jgi:hypothetical protein
MPDAGLESGMRESAMLDASTASGAVPAFRIALSRISHPDPASRIGPNLAAPNSIPADP